MEQAEPGELPTEVPTGEAGVQMRRTRLEDLTDFPHLELCFFVTLVEMSNA